MGQRFGRLSCGRLGTAWSCNRHKDTEAPIRGAQCVPAAGLVLTETTHLPSCVQPEQQASVQAGVLTLSGPEWKLNRNAKPAKIPRTLGSSLLRDRPSNLNPYLHP